jgi:ribose 5-phosphate isomerase B
MRSWPSRNLNRDMKIALGSDHAGFELKEDLRAYLTDLNIDALDLGAYNQEAVDYPEVASRVAEKVVRGEVEKGILICGTGIGMSIVANRFPGVRAALCQDSFTARVSREHNNANILVLGGRLIGKGLAREILKIWLETEFQGGRHQTRLDKIAGLEEKIGRQRKK